MTTRQVLSAIAMGMIPPLVLVAILLFFPSRPDYATVVRERDSLAQRSEELEAANRVLQVASSHYAEAAMRAEGELNLLRAQCGPVITLGVRLTPQSIPTSFVLPLEQLPTEWPRWMEWYQGGYDNLQALVMQP